MTAWRASELPTNDLSWRDHAACAGMPHAFFGGRWVRIAKRLCGSCEVVDECLFFALATEENSLKYRNGVWGGTTPGERQNLVDNSPHLQPSRIMEDA